MSMLLRRRGIVAQGAGAPPAPAADPAPAYFQTDASVGVSFPDEQPAYFQTDASVGPEPFPDQQVGYFQTDQNVEE